VTPTAASPDPGDMPISKAVDRWLKKRETDATEQTLRGYRSRLDQFLKWCDEHGVETVADLDPWTLDEWQIDLGDEGYAKTTIKARSNTVRLWLEYLETVDLAEGLSDAIDIPNVTRREEQDETRLKQDDARAALTFFRDSREYYGTAMHAVLEVIWHTGARMGAVQGLDLDDFDADEQTLHFSHRPDTTPLKNKHQGERVVGLSDEVTEALAFYVARERSDKRDAEGRSPLFSTRQGRASHSSIRTWCYQATQPCLWMACPHDKRRPTCDWTTREECSKCPSSRSPHAIRTGSITWQLNVGYPVQKVSKRANVSIDVLEQHYDMASQLEEYRNRREEYETNLDISQNNE